MRVDDREGPARMVVQLSAKKRRESGQGAMRNAVHSRVGKRRALAKCGSF